MAELPPFFGWLNPEDMGKVALPEQ